MHHWLPTVGCVPDLHIAASLGILPIVQAQLQALGGGALTAVDGAGCRPLHRACQAKHVEVRLCSCDASCPHDTIFPLRGSEDASRVFQALLCNANLVIVTPDCCILTHPRLDGGFRWWGCCWLRVPSRMSRTPSAAPPCTWPRATPVSYKRSWLLELIHPLSMM